VYAIQAGRARILEAMGPESRVQVGNFIYWHIRPAVTEGELIEPYRQVVGHVNRGGLRHLHLSEVSAAGSYLNPLRSGGRLLSPWRDTSRPVLSHLDIRPDGRVYVKAFTPQSFHELTRYLTPVLAPAALAYEVFDSRGRRVVPLRWALRGTHVVSFSLAARLYAPDAHSGGFGCFATRVICKPNWDYVLAGGLAPALEPSALAPGRYRMSAYAWDWAGNTAARDAWFEIRAHGWPRLASVSGPPASRSSPCRRSCSRSHRRSGHRVTPAPGGAR
jgi:hypothetical protein